MLPLGTALAPFLAGAILAAYMAALWRFFRRESWATWLALSVICAFSLAVRVAYTTDFPSGFNDDEHRLLGCANEALDRGALFGEGCTGIPQLLNVLFQAQLAELIGPGRWAIRSYSLFTSILATLAAFAVARAMRARVSTGLAAAGLVAVLPWSLFYGRISIGGELVFHQLLLLAALARLVWQRGEWSDVGIGVLGLSLLLYDYFAGRVMLAMPVWAAVLARGRNRLLCLAVLVLAVLSWAPHLAERPRYVFGVLAEQQHPNLLSQPVETLRSKTITVLEAFTAPVGVDSFLAVSAGALHPWPVLVLAVLGSLTGVRRSLFLWGGFVGGLLPSILSGQMANSHRMMMAFPFVSIAAACALDLIPWRAWRKAAAIALVLAVGSQSVSIYFSDKFWSWGARQQFQPDKSALAEALRTPGPRPLVVVPQVWLWPRLLTDPARQILSADNWFPLNRAVVYGFSEEWGKLRPFYDAILGPPRVRSFGEAFLVDLEDGDWSWLRRHGWAYEAACGTDIRRGQVPTLFHVNTTFRDLQCQGPVVHRWQGVWRGAGRTLRLRFSGESRVETSGNTIREKTGWESAVDFSVQHDETILVSVTSPGSLVYAVLLELGPAGERVPAWERVSPVSALP
jgi:hypothetical protein